MAALQLGANLINDYYDSLGSDPLNLHVTPFSGGSRVIQNREMSPGQVRALAYLFLALGAACGLSLIYLGRPWVALVGLLGLAAALGYSVSPLQLMSGGLGEFLIFLAFGPLLTWGAYYVQTGRLSLLGAMASLPLAFLITAIIWINEFPDLEADMAAAKRHLVARLGLQWSRWVYAGLMLAPFASLFVLIELFRLPDLLVAGSGPAAPGGPGRAPGLAHPAHRPRIRHGPGPDHSDPLLHGPDPHPGPALRGLVAVKWI